MKKLYRVFEIISNIFAAISFIGVFIGVIFVVVDVIMRYLFKTPIPGDYDITQLWLSVIVFASLAYVQTQKGHVGVTMVIKALPQKIALAVFGVATLVGAFISGICAYSCYELALRAVARNTVSMMAHIPLYPFEYFEGICMALLCIVMILDAILCFMAIGDKEAAEKITSTWA